MKRSLITFLPYALGALILCGCVSVTSRQPVGETPVALDARLWNGAWSDDDEVVVHFRVKDATNGVLEVGVVELSDSGMKFNQFAVQVRKTGDWLWASFKDQGETEYTFVRISEPDRHLLVWGPDPAAFVKRVRAGTVKGELKRDEQGKETGSVIIDELTAAHIRALEAGDWKDAFDLGKPGVLRRIGPTPVK